MRLATIIFDSQPRLVTADHEGQLYPVGALVRSVSAELTAPASMLELIELPAQQYEQVKCAITTALASGAAAPIKAEGWLPPVPRPSKVVGVALNNSSLAQLAYRYFDKPAFFLKAPSSLIGHERSIAIHESYGLTHPEPELAFVIGRRASHVTESAALSHVFGYTIMNDVTSVGLKDEDSIHFRIPLPSLTHTWRKRRGILDGDIYLTYHGRSKSTDTFGPMGPFLVTSDEVPNPNDLGVRSWIGSELIADDSTANLRFSVQQVIAHLSSHMTLEPGDVVHMGTAVKSKLPTLRKHDMRKKHGDCTIEIAHVGRLVNRIAYTA